MASATLGQAERARVGRSLTRAVADGGSAGHAYLVGDALLRGPDAARNLADAVHFLCLLYGRQPCAIDHAGNRCLEQPERDWFRSALAEFAAERTLLTRLVVAAGPIPSTAGAVDSENAVLHQRHAIEMLAQSERRGCALGAALGIALDWAAIRIVLNAAGTRFGIESLPYRLGDAQVVAALADESAVTPGMERAILFGATQIAIQHRGLWDLLEARQQARALLP